MFHWKNFLIQSFVRVLQWVQKPGKADRFLIVSTTGLGDTLWGTPGIRALREAYPSAYIGCLTSPLGAEVLKNNPYLTEIFVLKKPVWLSLIPLYRKLRKRKIGTALLFHTSQRAILPLCASIGTSRRIGTAGLQKGLDALLTKALPWKAGHEIERRLDMLRAIDVPISSYDMDFFIQESDRKAAAKLLPNKPVIGIHPGAKDLFKTWPPSYFLQVGKALQEKLGCTIVITGTPSEKSLVESICQQIDGAKSLIEPLGTMAAALGQMTLFITNDTGPLHLALAMKTPTLALFTPTDPNVCGPYRNQSAQIIRAKPTCFPCLKKKCLDPFCLRQISPQQVISTAIEQWEMVLCK